MDAGVTHDMDSVTERRFVTEADWIPGFWNYLLDLDRDDLVAELIQNDLDQDATRTVISFEEDRLVCEGNGKPVEAEGWLRLRKIQGAGHSVPAKRGKIGVKNHGLKTAFTVGDELQIMSAGQSIIQTLYRDGRNKPPYPGASREPTVDKHAPADGCRIIIWYRRHNIEPQQGEATVLGAVSHQDIDTLFLSACGSTPEQFAGIVSPEIARRYEIVLRHWKLGEARFLFSCTQPLKTTKRIELFRRRCSVGGNLSDLPGGLVEQAARRLVPLKGRLRQRIPDFFRRGRNFYVEVSWSIDRSGKPKIGTERYRYPIGFPQESHEARTGHSAHFNAPIVCDNKRHGPARNEATNKELRLACDALLTDALARYAVPRWGAAGLNPLVPTSGTESADEAIRSLLATLVRQGAMPVLKWREAAELLLKRKTQTLKAAIRRIAGRDGATRGRRYRMVIPKPTWSVEAVHSPLAVLCPRSEMQLDPRTHPDIVRLLVNKETPGWCEEFITFDEADAFSRMSNDGNQWFSGVRDPELEFSEPLIARSCLDLTHQALDNGKCEVGEEDNLLEALLLPVRHAQARPIGELYCSAPLPSDVPGLRLPPLLHDELTGHSLFKRRKWHRPNYTMARFLESGTLQAADEDTRRLFWLWLHQNVGRIAARERPRLAEVAIWPDETGSLCTIAELCDPGARRIGMVLGDSIRRPHEQVRRSKLVSARRQARTSIRRVPTSDEIYHWLNTRMAGFVVGDEADSATTDELGRFETDLTVLLSNPTIARLLKAAQMTLPALARDGSIQPRTGLVMPSSRSDRLALSDRFVLNDRQYAALLDKISPALEAPTATMLLDTFSEDPENFPALHARLEQFLTITSAEDDARPQLAEMPIIPTQRAARAPSVLAFSGSRGDYWGDWKTHISTKGLSQDEQRRYRAVGVTSAVPDLYTSHDFFEWLSEQNETVLSHHITCVLRHILHRDGPAEWAPTFTDTPCIPVRSRRGVRLVSLRTARSAPVFLPDAGDIGDAVIQRDPAVLLAIDRAREVAEPISDRLLHLRIRSLRMALKEPVDVTGTGEIAIAGEDILVRFRALLSRQFRRTLRKRLNDLGVTPELLRRDWHDRLSGIAEIRFADEVHARYRFRRKLYRDDVEAGFDAKSRVFWMKRDRRIKLRTFYEAVTRQLVFTSEARPIDLLALERALEIQVHDPSFGRPADTQMDAIDDVVEKDDDPIEDTDDVESEPGEALDGHSPFTPDPTRNVPRPRPIPTNAEGRTRRPSPPNDPPRQDQDERDSQPAPPVEAEQTTALKGDHYASHCQMCLCLRSPWELAPNGSYVQWEEVRRRIVEAHHVDPKSGGGARHAGNLILLCKMHHDNYGRRLSRAAVTAALRRSPKEMYVDFGTDSRVMGQRVELTISDTDEVVVLFFTDHHAAYWLSLA